MLVKFTLHPKSIHYFVTISKFSKAIPLSFDKITGKFKRNMWVDLGLPIQVAFAFKTPLTKCSCVIKFSLEGHILALYKLVVQQYAYVNISIWKVEIAFNWVVLIKITDKHAPIRIVLFSFALSSAIFFGKSDVTLVDKERLNLDLWGFLKDLWLAQFRSIFQLFLSLSELLSLHNG
jgi:hypothetical protein